MSWKVIAKHGRAKTTLIQVLRHEDLALGMMQRFRLLGEEKQRISQLNEASRSTLTSKLDDKAESLGFPDLLVHINLRPRILDKYKAQFPIPLDKYKSLFKICHVSLVFFSLIVFRTPFV